MNKALALEVARELKMSPEKVHEICKSFHDGLRELVLHPDDCKGGIMIHGFLSINFKKYKLEVSLDRNEYSKDMKQAILNNLEKYKRNDQKEQAES